MGSSLRKTVFIFQVFHTKRRDGKGGRRREEGGGGRGGGGRGRGRGIKVPARPNGAFPQRNGG